MWPEASAQLQPLQPTALFELQSQHSGVNRAVKGIHVIKLPPKLFHPRNTGPRPV